MWTLRALWVVGLGYSALACSSGGTATPEQQRADAESARLEEALARNAPPERTPALAAEERAAEAKDAPVEPLPASAVAAPASGCPAGTVPVQGQYCTEVRHNCTKWMDDPKLQYARCAEYEPVATCVGKRVPMSFCIDQEEYTPPGEDLPMNWASFNTAAKVCKERGMRVCTEREWNFACEGEEMRPYPYGWRREPVCNYDRDDLYVQTPKKRLLKDLRQPAGANPECVSPFGVHDMVGNVDEPVLREEARYNPPFRNALKGGWWMAARNRCRPATTAHDDHYNDIQVGVRCCSDAPGVANPSG